VINNISALDNSMQLKGFYEDYPNVLSATNVLKNWNRNLKQEHGMNQTNGLSSYALCLMLYYLWDS